MTVYEAFLEQDLLDLQNKVDEKDKRIAELEKENEKLKKRCDSYEMRMSKMEKGTCDVCKENVEQKKKDRYKNWLRGEQVPITSMEIREND